MKRMVAMLLSALLLLPLLAACGDADEKSGAGEIESGTREVLGEGYLLASALADYSIVYPESGISIELRHSIRALQALTEEKFGAELKSKDDFIRPSVGINIGEYEILLGNTNREESAAVYDTLEKINDYEIRLCGKKLVIAAWSDEALMAVFERFKAAIEALPNNSAYFFAPSMQVSHCGEYAVEEILLQEVSISDYTVVYEDTPFCKSLAQQLANAVSAKSGHILRTVADGEAVTGNCIFIGNTSKGAPADAASIPADGYYLGISGGDLYLYATANPPLYQAFRQMNTLLEGASGETAVIDPNVGLVLSADTSMTAMSFNLWVGEMTSERMAAVVKMICKYNPDTFGVQEANEKWINYLESQLSDVYAHVGVGRNANGKGERSSVFYKKEKFTVVESGTKWMSATPDRVSKVEGSLYNRIFTYAVLERKSDNLRFMHINTHTDHTGDDTVRLAQVKVITEFLKGYADMPTLISGDFNSTVVTPSIKHVLSAGLENSSAVAMDGDRTPTFSTRVIDYIFVTAGDFTVYEYWVDNSKINNIQPSDHNPVLIRYDVNV